MLNGHTLHSLVNNAGAAFYGPLMYQPIDEFRKNIEINLVGTLQVTQVSSARGNRAGVQIKQLLQNSAGHHLISLQQLAFCTIAHSVQMSLGLGKRSSSDSRGVAGLPSMKRHR